MDDSRKRILVVDDDEAIRVLLFTILRRRGMAVDTACNGQQALERLRACRYAVMLLDLMMPVMNGWQTLEWLEQQPADVRPMAIVLTAGNEPRPMNPELVAGTVHKPFDVELLIDMVSGCLAALAPRTQAPECPAPDSDRCAPN